MDDVNLSVYDFCEKYKDGAESPSKLLSDLRGALDDHISMKHKKFPDAYTVEKAEYESEEIDFCEKMMLLTTSKDDCENRIVNSIALYRARQHTFLTPQEQESIGQYLGTLGRDIKKVQERADDIFFCYQPKLFNGILPGLLFLLMSFAMLFLPALRNWFLDPAIESQVGVLVGVAAVTMFIICAVKFGGGSLIRSFLSGFGCCILTMFVMAFLIGLLDGMADPGPYVLAYFSTFCFLIALWLIISSMVKAARIKAHNRAVEAERTEILSELDKLYNYAQICKNRAQYLKLDSYSILLCEEYSDAVQYYRDILNTLNDIRNSLT